MKQYRLFFSWQNYRKNTKRIVFSALKSVVEKLANEDIELLIDQDTRSRVGKKNIDAEVLDKIRKCDIFVADLTPVITYIPPKETHDLPKHLPNSNVMYEYGYALHAKGEDRMIALASLNKEEDEHLEFMPFDINHDTITLFTDVNSLGGLYGWIKKIIDKIEIERASYVPQYACSLLFLSDGGFTDEITIHPRYRRIHYTAESHKKLKHMEEEPISVAQAAVDPFKMQRAFIDQLSRPTVQATFAKVVNKTTNYSLVPVRMVFTNRGSEALDNIKLHILANDDRITYNDTNEKHQIPMLFARSIHDTSIGDKMIFQNAATLNPSDSLFLNDVYIHAPHDIGTFSLNWKLGSRKYPDSGTLTIHVVPEYDEDWVENDELAGTEKVDDFKVYE